VTVAPAANLVGPYNALLEKRLAFESARTRSTDCRRARKQAVGALPYADKRMAAMLVKRTTSTWPMLGAADGKGIAQYVFGLGVMGWD
jgi:hypothetical protein